MALESLKNRTRKAQANANAVTDLKRKEALFKETVKEVETIVQGYKDKYNTAEARAKREKEYQELQEIGAKRAAAFQKGEPLSNYPLPWEKTTTTETIIF